MGRLDGKVAICTGSTSGMGRSTAYLFAKEGAKVVVTGRDEKRAQEVVENIKKAGGEAMYVLVDMTDLNDIKKIIPKTVEAYGTVDILFNNAGMLSLTPITEMTLEEWNRVFSVNLTAAMLLAQQVAPIMKKKGKGSIINTSSVAGYAAHFGPVAYSTSKHAMEGLNKAMANELGPEIRANCIAPGAIVTAMLDQAGGEAAVSYMIDGAPLKRPGKPEEIATVALFFATDDSSFVTGQSLRVDGGFEC
ncbi:Cyclopentanol dehydrogenase [Methanosarcinaceae archaeon Ag5]|uniref:Cyclopentanol dehydrogenase n=1 Tax=Methanolapillus africanus TaxID=3028297 RepID=A0AAE4MKD6_9EURY|nr:Cyclopentanol dehydrogenase [Methanosarcinaceae archaeon Ag5]